MQFFGASKHRWRWKIISLGDYVLHVEGLIGFNFPEGINPVNGGNRMVKRRNQYQSLSVNISSNKIYFPFMRAWLALVDNGLELKVEGILAVLNQFREKERITEGCVKDPMGEAAKKTGNVEEKLLLRHGGSDAVDPLCGAETQFTPESTVGVLTMVDKGVRVLATPTSDLGKILCYLHDLEMGGELTIVAATQAAELARKHRQNTHQQIPPQFCDKEKPKPMPPSRELTQNPVFQSAIVAASVGPWNYSSTQDRWTTSLVLRGKSPCLAKSLCYPLIDGGSKTGSENSGAVFNLNTSIIGVEIKALPVAMKVLGLVLEFVLIISMGISAQLLVRLSVLCKAVVYGEFVQYAIGWPARLLSENRLIVNNVVVTVVYLIVLGDVMTGSVHHVEVSDQWLGNENWNQLMILVVLVLFLVPLCAFKRIDSLSVTFAASVAFIVVCDENEEGLEAEDDKEYGDICCWACEKTYAADGFWICCGRIQYITFTTYLGFLVCLLWNIVAFAMTIAWIKGEGSRNWFLAIIYFLSKVPEAYVWWCRPLYRVVRTDSALKLGWVFLSYVIRIGSCTFVVVDPPISFKWKSLTGILPAIAVLNNHALVEIWTIVGREVSLEEEKDAARKAVKEAPRHEKGEEPTSNAENATKAEHVDIADPEVARRGGSNAGQDKKNQSLSKRELLSASTWVLVRETHVRKGELQILATYSMKRCSFFVKDKNVLHNMCSLFAEGRHESSAGGYVFAAADTLIRVDKFMAIF
jgi:hypothetical protein